MILHLGTLVGIQDILDHQRVQPKAASDGIEQPGVVQSFDIDPGNGTGRTHKTVGKIGQLLRIERGGVVVYPCDTRLLALPLTDVDQRSGWQAERARERRHADAGHEGVGNVRREGDQVPLGIGQGAGVVEAQAGDPHEDFDQVGDRPGFRWLGAAHQTAKGTSAPRDIPEPGRPRVRPPAPATTSRSTSPGSVAWLRWVRLPRPRLGG